MKNNVIVVLGGGIDVENKEMPNSWTKLRFDKAMEIYLKFPNDSVIISTSERTYRLKYADCTEAQAGKNYLLERYSDQINDGDIIIEDKSKDTFSNAYYVAYILIKEGLKGFHVITSEFHMKKSKWIFEEIVFPKENGWNILFHESPNGDVDELALQSRLNSEELVLSFYKNHLTQDFGVIPGDMETIGNFMLNFSKAYNPESDEPYQEKLTKDIQKANLKLTNLIL